MCVIVCGLVRAKASGGDDGGCVLLLGWSVRRRGSGKKRERLSAHVCECATSMWGLIYLRTGDDDHAEPDGGGGHHRGEHLMLLECDGGMAR